MKFRYKKYSKGLLRPVIPIQVEYQGRKVSYEVLLDSGSDSNIFHAALTPMLGINLKLGEKQLVGGIIFGQMEPYWIHTVNIVVGGYRHENIKVGFKNLSTEGYGVVGQNGFFDLYIIKFDLKKGEIELKPR